MLITAVPCMFLYQWLEGRGCVITPDHGAPVHNVCFTLSILVTLVTGILVNGPYALITTAVSAELGKIARYPFGRLSPSLISYYALAEPKDAFVKLSLGEAKLRELINQRS